MRFNLLKLAALLSATVFAADADKAPRRRAFNAADFLPAAVAQVAVVPVVPVVPVGEQEAREVPRKG